jgi:SP family general alpha glucoside:H+ symporter-like MFS transporter
MVEHQEDTADPQSTTVMDEKADGVEVVPEDVLAGAQLATDGEHAMTLREGLRKYPMACFWSIWFSSALIMEGFDHAFIAGFIAYPAFQQRYGVLQANGGYQIPSDIQAGINNGVQAGEILGLLFNGCK